MKKILLILAVVMTLAFVACGGRQTKVVEATETEVVTVDECDGCCGADAEDAAETVTEEVVEAE